MFARPRDQVVRVHASLGHHRQPDHRGLHARRHRHVGRPHRPHPGGGRRQARRPAAERLRLRPVHRRARPALRRRAPGLHRRAHLRRQHRAAAQDHARLRRHGPELHARPTPCTWATPRAIAACAPRTCPCGSASTAPSPGPTSCACRSRRPGHRRPGHLRPLRDGRPRRRLRVPVQGRHARQRGPLPGRDRGPGDAAAAARRPGRRAGVHHALARRRSRSSATARGTCAVSSPSPAPAAAPRCA